MHSLKIKIKPSILGASWNWKNITKNKCGKSIPFKKYYSRIWCHLICSYKLRYSVHLPLLRKWPVFLQNAS